MLFRGHWASTALLDWEKQTKLSRLMRKPTKWHLRPAKTRISLGICPVWSVFAVRMKRAWVLSYPLSAQRRLWSDWVDAQADLSLCWAHSHFADFVMRRLIPYLFPWTKFKVIQSFVVSKIHETKPLEVIQVCTVLFAFSWNHSRVFHKLILDNLVIFQVKRS